MELESDKGLVRRSSCDEDGEDCRSSGHAEGLRHGFGIKAVTCGVPLNTLQQLFGHAQLSTTSIYADAMGPEKRQLVERMWN